MLTETLQSRWQRIADRQGDRPAVIGSEGSLGVRALRDRSTAIARCLNARCGDRCIPVPVLCNPGIDAISAILGVVQAGHACVPLDPSAPQQWLAGVLHQLGAPAVICDAGLEETGRTLTKRTEMDVIPISRHALPANPVSTPYRRPSADDLALVLYSSGSTGVPKGVMHSHRSALHAIDLGIETRSITTHDRLGLLWTHAHVGGLMDIFRGLFAGAALAPCSPLEQGLGELGEWLRRLCLTQASMVPTIFRRLAASLESGPRLTHLRLLAIGGEELTADDVALFSRYFDPGCVMINGLGASELPAYAHQTIRPGDSFLQVPVGRALRDHEIGIVDRRDQEVPSGQVGEIRVRSAYLSPGYFGDTTASGLIFRPDPSDGAKAFFRTGDLGSLDPQGRLLYHGRRDLVIKIHGHRVPLGEVEATLRQHPEVTDAAVVVAPMPCDAATQERLATEGQRLVAFVQTMQPQSDLGPRLRSFLRSRLHAYRIPTSYRCVAELPLLHSGKVDRQALTHTARPLGHGQERLTSEPLIPAVTPLQHRIASIWQRTLCVDFLGIDDTLFELGADSLTILILHQIMLDHLGVAPPLEDLDLNTTVRHIAVEVERLRGMFGSHRTPARISRNIVVKDRFSGECQGLRNTILPRMQAWAGHRYGSDAPIIGHHGTGSGLPLFWCLQSEFEFLQLGQALSTHRPLYGMRSGHDLMFYSEENLTCLARWYADAIIRIQPDDGYLLGGNCQGGAIAWETARVLMARDRNVRLLCLLDRPMPEPYPGRIAFFFGENSSYNPRNQNFEPETAWADLYPLGFSIDTINAGHGKYFRDGTINSLAAALEIRINQI